MFAYFVVLKTPHPCCRENITSLHTPLENLTVLTVLTVIFAPKIGFVFLHGVNFIYIYNILYI